jgi:hypothetical protein
MSQELVQISFQVFISGAENEKAIWAVVDHLASLMHAPLEEAVTTDHLK